MKVQIPGKLSDPFFSLIVFSLYSGFIGAILLLAPHTILPQFEIRENINAFTYMLGFVLICSSFYYLSAGIQRNHFFAGLIVCTRLVSPLITLILFFVGNVPLNFIYLGILDAIGGVWTLITLKKIPLKDGRTHLVTLTNTHSLGGGR